MKNDHWQRGSFHLITVEMFIEHCSALGFVQTGKLPQEEVEAQGSFKVGNVIDFFMLGLQH